MLELVFSLPLWALALTLNVWLMGFALVGLRAFRRWALPRLNIGDDDADLYYSAAVMQSAMMLYGLVAALTAVSVWSQYSQVSDVVSSEATTLARLWRDVRGYPQAERDALQDELRGYTEQIINEAWPEQRQGRTPQDGVEHMNRLQAQLFAFEPRLESQKILHAETLSAFNSLIQARRLRLDAVGKGLPVVMWFVLMPGAMGCVFLAFFFRIRDTRYQAILAASLSGFIAMVLFVIVALDQPFRGAMAIGPDSYRLVHQQLMRR
jgi:hypothetical protein